MLFETTLEDIHDDPLTRGYYSFHEYDIDDDENDNDNSQQNNEENSVNINLFSHEKTGSVHINVENKT